MRLPQNLVHQGMEARARDSAIITSAYPLSTVAPKCYGVLAIHRIPASAWFADAVFAGDEADANALTDLPFGHSAAESLDAANDFVPRNAWKRETWVSAHNRGHIGVTYSAGFDADSNLARSRLRHRPFDDPKHTRC